MSKLIVMAAVVAAVLVVTMPAVSQELPPGGTFVDDDGNTHEGYIEAVAAAEVTAGCNEAGTRYCPSDAVTRGQMATFLARALGLSNNGHPDAFTDDDGSVHEPWINAMAALGITAGCDTVNPALFCPEEPVNRGQMATFLVRALTGLNPSTVDAFIDDDGSVHEQNIDGIALAGVTQGCSTSDPSRYCPGDPVRRDQMAAFLGRALGLTPMV
ncbi:MAG: S-layer homology domain-containing protein, partial [Acidimicrobiia bacterium]|nr:S-layer homology domain-containing protein [Acidimicrobiia bacterium]